MPSGQPAKCPAYCMLTASRTCSTYSSLACVIRALSCGAFRVDRAEGRTLPPTTPGTTRCRIGDDASRPRETPLRRTGPQTRGAQQRVDRDGGEVCTRGFCFSVHECCAGGWSAPVAVGVDRIVREMSRMNLLRVCIYIHQNNSQLRTPPAGASCSSSWCAYCP